MISYFPVAVYGHYKKLKLAFWTVLYIIDLKCPLCLLNEVRQGSKANSQMHANRRSVDNSACSHRNFSLDLINM